jgi:hypothetical protein
MTTLYTADSFLDAIAHYMIDERNDIDTDCLVETTVNDELDAIQNEANQEVLETFMADNGLVQVCLSEVTRETEKAYQICADLPTFIKSPGGGICRQVSGLTWIPKNVIMDAPVSTDFSGTDKASMSIGKKYGDWILVKKWWANKAAKEIYNKYK